MTFNILDIIANFLSASSILVAISIYCNTARQSKRTETLNALNDLFDTYYEIDGSTGKEDYREYVRFISKVDRFAVAFVEKIYDRKLTKARAGEFLCRQYRESMRKIIEQRREQFEREDYYEAIDKMIRIIENDNR